MDSIPPRNTRGRARSDPPPHVSRSQFHGAQPGQPQHIVSIPRSRQPSVFRGEYFPQPRQPANVSMIRMPNWSNQPTQIRASLPQLSSPKNNDDQSSNSLHIVKIYIFIINFKKNIDFFNFLYKAEQSGELNKLSTDIVNNEVVQLQTQEESTVD